jgi:hypothetical protein
MSYTRNMDSGLHEMQSENGIFHKLEMYNQNKLEEEMSN